jgi:hypothetical protein
LAVALAVAACLGVSTLCEPGVSILEAVHLAEIYLCQAWSDHEIEDGNARAGVLLATWEYGAGVLTAAQARGVGQAAAAAAATVPPLLVTDLPGGSHHAGALRGMQLRGAAAALQAGQGWSVRLMHTAAGSFPSL